LVNSSIDRRVRAVPRKKLILIVEDEQEYLSAVSGLLRERGYNVIESTTTEEAIRAARSNTPDLILADIKLPGADGFDFIDELKKVDSCRGVPFIFVTAYNNLQAADYAKKHGAVDYITKPFDFEYLLARIHQITPI
jgi:CheY-like chemotaxis protein